MAVPAADCAPSYKPERMLQDQSIMPEVALHAVVDV